jgi:hypothetical protein
MDPSEPFTPIEQVCHVKDIEIDGYHVRIHRTLEESHPLLASIDGEALAKERFYSSADTAEVFAQFRDARAKTLELVVAPGQDGGSSGTCPMILGRHGHGVL